MTEDEHDIMAVVCMDKREVELKSTNMEVNALSKGLALLMDEQGFKIAELVTDAHPQIPPLLS